MGALTRLKPGPGVALHHMWCTGGRKYMVAGFVLGGSHFHFSLSCTEKETATHSSVLAWRIPGTGEPAGLPSMGSHRVGHIQWREELGGLHTVHGVAKS